MMLADWSQFDDDLAFADCLDNKKSYKPLPLLSLIDDPAYHKINAEILWTTNLKRKFSKFYKKKKTESKIKIAYFSPDLGNTYI